jgi:hypothetical protein
VAKDHGVVIDFDSTCTVKADGSENPKMRKLAMALEEKGVSVTVYTTRSVEEVEEWLADHQWPMMPVTNEKSVYKVMLDDRGVQFEPTMLHDIPALTEGLNAFKSWWEKSEGPRTPPVSRSVDVVRSTIKGGRTRSTGIGAVRHGGRMPWSTRAVPAGHRLTISVSVKPRSTMRSRAVSLAPGSTSTIRPALLAKRRN